MSSAQSRYSNAADALAALVDAAASAPPVDVAKVKEAKQHEAQRDEEMSSSSARRAAAFSEQQQQQQQQEAERRSMQSPYGGVAMPTGVKSHPGYLEGTSASGKEKNAPTKSRIEEELRTRGKTTITAANFIDVIITRQIAPDKDARERGSQNSDSSGSSKFISSVV